MTTDDLMTIHISRHFRQKIINKLQRRRLFALSNAADGPVRFVPHPALDRATACSGCGAGAESDTLDAAAKYEFES
ncbi:MAG: hypothetical protein FD180_3029 [Planctomycetota bacterium]|nr:MAG: hypothetical protein FD180_3029 [Planctomycetota bacterium]